MASITGNFNIFVKNTGRISFRETNFEMNGMATIKVDGCPDVQVFYTWHQGRSKQTIDLPALTYEQTDYTVEIMKAVSEVIRSFNDVAGGIIEIGYNVSIKQVEYVAEQLRGDLTLGVVAF